MHLYINIKKITARDNRKTFMQLGFFNNDFCKLIFTIKCE